MGTHDNTDTNTNMTDDSPALTAKVWGFYGNGRLTVGYVDEANGPCPMEIPGFALAAYAPDASQSAL